MSTGPVEYLVSGGVLLKGARIPQDLVDVALADLSATRRLGRRAGQHVGKTVEKHLGKH